jgi:hypothetical protein
MKFLGLHIDDDLNWTNHIDKFIPKLCGACYAVRSMCHIINTVNLKSNYFAYFHSTVKYGIILGLKHVTVKRCSHYKRKCLA